MIKLFITDIDGCLMEPMKPPRWDILTKIRSLNIQSKDDPTIPPLTLCTGRPMPYAEAVAQMMNIVQPFVFESAGVFDPAQYRLHLDGILTNDIHKQIGELKEWLQHHIMNEYSGTTLEFSKLMDAGIIHPDNQVIQQILPTVQEYIARNYPDFEVHQTNVSINIILKKIIKKRGSEGYVNG